MSEEMKLAQAKKAYGVICSALDARGWKYNTDEEKLLVYFGVNGDDLPMNFIIRADADRQLMRLHSPMSFKMAESKRIEGAVATCVVNYKIADGSFEYDLRSGEIVFKMTATFRGSEINEELLHYMIGCSCAMVDEFNDAFLAISKGLLSLNDFIQKYA